MGQDEIDIEKLKSEIKNDKQRRIILFTIFASCLAGFFVLYEFSPQLNKQERDIIFRLPDNPYKMQELIKTIEKYTQNNFGYVLFAFVYIYVVLQSFAIPGPVFLSLLSGQLFGRVYGFILVCLCATAGASICFALSYSLARGLVLNWFPKAIIRFNKKIRENRGNLFFYMLFLRFTPLIPNVSINVSAPIVGLPYKYFALGTLFGLMPGNIIHIQTGMALAELTDLGQNRFYSIIMLLGLSVLALVPTFIKKRYAKDDDKEEETKLIEGKKTKQGFMLLGLSVLELVPTFIKKRYTKDDDKEEETKLIEGKKTKQG